MYTDHQEGGGHVNLLALAAIPLGCVIVVIWSVYEKRLETIGLMLAAVAVPLVAVRVFSLRVPVGFGLFYLFCGTVNLVYLLVRAQGRGRAALATVVFGALGVAFILLPAVDTLTFLAGTLAFLVAAFLSPALVQVQRITPTKV
jgi:hypothetical protein